MEYPPGNDHDRDVMLPVDKSLKVTVLPKVAEVGVAEKFATGPVNVNVRSA